MPSFLFSWEKCKISFKSEVEMWIFAYLSQIGENIADHTWRDPDTIQKAILGFKSGRYEGVR